AAGECAGSPARGIPVLPRRPPEPTRRQSAFSGHLKRYVGGLNRVCFFGNGYVTRYRTILERVEAGPGPVRRASLPARLRLALLIRRLRWGLVDPPRAVGFG